jgi:hypothetical protein
LLDGVVIDDTDLFSDKLQEWEDFYNLNPTEASTDKPLTNGYRTTVGRHRPRAVGSAGRLGRCGELRRSPGSRFGSLGSAGG